MQGSILCCYVLYCFSIEENIIATIPWKLTYGRFNLGSPVRSPLPKTEAEGLIDYAGQMVAGERRLFQVYVF